MVFVWAFNSVEQIKKQLVPEYIKNMEDDLLLRDSTDNSHATIVGCINWRRWRRSGFSTILPETASSCSHVVTLFLIFPYWRPKLFGNAFWEKSNLYTIILIKEITLQPMHSSHRLLSEHVHISEFRVQWFKQKKKRQFISHSCQETKNPLPQNNKNKKEARSFHRLVLRQNITKHKNWVDDFIHLFKVHFHFFFFFP